MTMIHAAVREGMTQTVPITWATLLSCWPYDETTYRYNIVFSFPVLNWM